MYLLPINCIRNFPITFSDNLASWCQDKFKDPLPLLLEPMDPLLTIASPYLPQQLYSLLFKYLYGLKRESTTFMVKWNCKSMIHASFYNVWQFIIYLLFFNYMWLIVFNYFTALPKDSDLITKEELIVVDSHGEKVKGIREVLSRDHMKVAFFGR